MKSTNFTLEDKDGNAHTLHDIKSKFVVLFFYPKDNTPGCSIEAKGFSDVLSEFISLDCQVFGISGGTNKTKQKFCDAKELSVPLLSDTDFKVSESFGVYKQKSFMGRSYMGIDRVTFVLDSNKKIIHTFENVKPVGHAQEVLEWISLNKPNNL